MKSSRPVRLVAGLGAGLGLAAAVSATALQERTDDSHDDA